MCYVIITSRSILWTLVTILSTLFMVASVCSPQWLVGQPRKTGLSSSNLTDVGGNDGKTFTPTLGIFNRCTRLHRFGEIYHRDSCATYVTGFGMSTETFPNTWKAALVFFVFGGLALMFTTVTATISLCMRSLFGKSIFTLSGLIQSIAGLFCLIGIILYPAGWGSMRIKKLCGEFAGPYVIDNCDLGWSFYLCIAGIVMTFLSAVLSVKADVATSSQKVEEKILEGRNLICVV